MNMQIQKLLYIGYIRHGIVVKWAGLNEFLKAAETQKSDVQEQTLQLHCASGTLTGKGSGVVFGGGGVFVV